MVKFNLMKSLFKNNKGGKFFDVHAPNINALKRWLFFWREGGVVNLRQRKYRLLMAGGVFLIVILSFFGLRNILTRAEVANFHAATCLGTWQNPEKAQETPADAPLEDETIPEPFDPAQGKPETTPEPEPEPNLESTDEPTAFKFLPVKLAFAETTSSELENPSEPILTENSSPTEDQVVENPPAEN